VLIFGAYSFCPEESTFCLNAERLQVSSICFDLALMLFTKIGQTVSHADLIERLWGTEYTLRLRPQALTSRICRLRQVPGLQDGKYGYYVETMYHRGYRISVL